jgi:regulator of sigma E protease
MSLFSIFLFIVILIALVIVHELGHFLAAKALKVRVDEFAFGFPPKLFSKKFGETEYVFNSLPLGGYVKIHGEDGEEGGAPDKRSLASKSWWQQLIVLLGGVTMNMLFALLILIVLALGKTPVGEDDALFARATDKKLIVTEVLENSPASLAGIKAGVEIVSLSRTLEAPTFNTTREAIDFIQKSDAPLRIVYKEKEGAESTVTIAPVYGLLEGKKAIGVGLNIEGLAKLNIFEAVKKGWSDLIRFTVLIAKAYKDFFATLLSGGNVADQVAGPVGLAKVVHTAEQMGLRTVALLAAIISINLAFFNILPFPSLDGGRSVIVIGEAIVRRKMNKKLFGALNAIGFSFLILVFVLVTIKDIFYSA